MPSDPVADAVVRQMRDAIIDNDLRLIAAVNRRIELVARLRAYKEAQGMEFVDHSREEWMHRYLQGANRGPLSGEGLRELYGHVLDLTKAETDDGPDGAAGASADGAGRTEPTAPTRS
jgi:chorismate mutase